MIRARRGRAATKIEKECSSLPMASIKAMKYRKHIRLKDYDYTTDGYYFVTICTNFRKPYLENDKINNIVVAELARLNDLKGVKMDFYVVMPNHIHMIIILEESEKSLSEIIGAFKSITTNVAAPLAGAIKYSDLHDSVGRDKPCDYKRSFKLWQPNYYEHIIRNEKLLDKIRKYIQDNPYKEMFDWNKIEGDVAASNAARIAGAKMASQGDAATR